MARSAVCWPLRDACGAIVRALNAPIDLQEKATEDADKEWCRLGDSNT